MPADPSPHAAPADIVPPAPPAPSERRGAPAPGSRRSVAAGLQPPPGRCTDEVEWAIEGRAAGGAFLVAPPTLGARLAVDQRQMCAHEECPPVDAGSSSSRRRLPWSCCGPRSPPSPSRTSPPGAASCASSSTPGRNGSASVGAG